MKRREFVTRSIAAGAAAWLVPGVADAATAVGLSPDAASATAAGAQTPMTRAWFEHRVGSTVLLAQDGVAPVRATIKAVRRLAVRKHRPHTAEVDQFSVVFALKTPSPIEGLCSARTAADGSFDIFISRADERGRTVHAPFSLLV